MRRNTPFPPVRRQPEPEPEPPPTRLALLRQRLARLNARFHSVFLVGAGILIALVALALYDSTQPPPQRLTQRDIDAAVARSMASATPGPSYASLAYEVIHPSLVRVHSLPPGAQSEDKIGVGSGVVIDDSGLILSSLHVVEGAAEIRVFFADGTESEAQVMVRQPENDLVVLSANRGARRPRASHDGRLGLAARRR